MALGIRSDAQMVCAECRSLYIFISLCDQYSLGSIVTRYLNIHGAFATGALTSAQTRVNTGLMMAVKAA